MKLTALKKKEPNMKAWGWRMLLGPASLIDGLVETISFSFFGVGAKLWASKNLALARIKAI
jgi:hypothetical protein